MDNIAFFDGSLVSFLGEAIRTCKSNEDLGLSADDTRFISDTQGKPKAYLRVVGDFDVSKCTKIMTVAEANRHMITILGDNRYSYVETNSTVVSTVLKQALETGTITPTDLVGKTPNQLNEWLFNKGIGGISKQDNYKPFSEV